MHPSGTSIFKIYLMLVFHNSPLRNLQQGILMVQLVDQYVTVILTIILAFFEVILIGWFYGNMIALTRTKRQFSPNQAY